MSAVVCCLLFRCLVRGGFVCLLFMSLWLVVALLLTPVGLRCWTIAVVCCELLVYDVCRVVLCVECCCMLCCCMLLVCCCLLLSVFAVCCPCCNLADVECSVA